MEELRNRDNIAGEWSITTTDMRDALKIILVQGFYLWRNVEITKMDVRESNVMTFEATMKMGERSLHIEGEVILNSGFYDSGAGCDGAEVRVHHSANVLWDIKESS